MSAPPDMLPQSPWEDGFSAAGSRDFTEQGEAFVLLSRAAQKIGRARFGAQWTGREFLTPEPVKRTPPNAIANPHGYAIWVAETIRRHDPEREFEMVASRPPAAMVESGVRQRNFLEPIPLAEFVARRNAPLVTFADGQEAITLTELEFIRAREAVAPLLLRKHEIIDLICRHAIREQMPSVYRNPRTHQVFHMPHLTWDGETLNERFETCRVNPARLMESTAGAPIATLAWIFLQERAVDELCASLISDRPKEAPKAKSVGNQLSANVQCSRSNANEAFKANGERKFETKKALAAAIRDIVVAAHPDENICGVGSFEKALGNKLSEFERFLSDEALAASSKIRAGKRAA